MDQCDEINPTASEACLRRYRKVYGDSLLNISIGFGYFDHGHPSHIVHDVAMRAAFVEALLTTPCPPNLSACGFRRDPDDADKLYKEVINPWGRTHRVELALTSGALSSNNEQNTNPYNRQRQAEYCEMATKRFMDNVKEGNEVVLYVGHSREGGGPDFCPPKLLPNKQRDYGYYRSKKPGHTRMLKALDHAKQKGKMQEIIGMLSCQTHGHFFDSYSSRAKETGFIMSHADTLSTHQLINLYGTLNSVLTQKCVEGFVPSVTAGKALKLRNMFTQEIP